MLTSSDSEMMNKSREGETIPIKTMNGISARGRMQFTRKYDSPPAILQKKLISSIIFAPLIPHEMLNRHIRRVVTMRYAQSGSCSGAA